MASRFTGLRALEYSQGEPGPEVNLGRRDGDAVNGIAQFPEVLTHRYIVKGCLRLDPAEGDLDVAVLGIDLPRGERALSTPAQVPDEFLVADDAQVPAQRPPDVKEGA